MVIELGLIVPNSHCRIITMIHQMILTDRNYSNTVCCTANPLLIDFLDVRTIILISCVTSRTGSSSSTGKSTSTTESTRRHSTRHPTSAGRHSTSSSTSHLLKKWTNSIFDFLFLGVKVIL